METNITKGEWSVNSIDLADYKSLAVISEKAQKVICHCHLSDMKISKENTENAQLISAAPDLFEALINIENDDNKIPATIWEMRNKALNKALGEEFFKTKAE